MLREKHKGGFFTSPITKHTSHIVGYAYVDDTDIIIMNNNGINLTMEEVVDDMQEAINIWEGGLKASGGAIVPAKSWVYPIEFGFDQSGQWHYKSKDEIGAEFTVKDHNNQLGPLQTLNVSEGRETLGLLLAPDGNNEDAVDELLKKATEWKELVQVGHLK